jgi:Signal transduction histidine kinase, nitrogen specific
MTISDALHRLLLDNLTTATILLDAELRLEYMNPAAEMLLAISGQRSHGQFISELFTESTEALNSLRQAVQQAHPFTKREAMLTALTGQTLTVDYAVTPILSNGNTLLLLEVHPRDRLLRITKEEAQLSKQETSKMLVRGLAHEIKIRSAGFVARLSYSPVNCRKKACATTPTSSLKKPIACAIWWIACSAPTNCRHWPCATFTKCWSA